jgi:NifU-like protein
MTARAINIITVVYPNSITRQISGLRHISSSPNAGAAGKEVNFTCGSFVRYSLVLDDGVVTSATFSSNGCGYMLAAADVLAAFMTGRHLKELHGLMIESLQEQVVSQIGAIPAGRIECIGACISALRAAFADLRMRQVEEFRGEKALLCTCFGVTEETVDMLLRDIAVDTVRDVTRICRAGGGCCGSCTMMIQEMLDNRLHGR